MIACGKYHSLFLVDNQVWATGANKEGQLGNGQTQTQYKPVLLKQLNDVIFVSAWNSSAALTSRNEVYYWGTSNCLVPTKI
jgi:alpha-tubulin suppressor-like RCC1 family protein